MTNITHEHLSKKGWAKEEVEKTIDILSRAHEKKTQTVRMMDNMVYWVALIISILGNFILSLLIIPFLWAIKPAFIYPAIAVLGISFGILFNIIIKDIETVARHQEIVAWMFIPALAIINVYFVTDFSNFVLKLMQIQQGIHNPLAVGATYGLAFVLPYIISFVRKK